MRIITGTLKGRQFNVPKNLDARPTSDRTKEGLFGVIEARRYIDDMHALDLFAGTGNLGFEAISRGAPSVLFVDESRESINFINKMAKQFGVEKRAHTMQQDIDVFLQMPHDSYDLIFADPPYDYPAMQEMVDQILENNWLNEDGWFVLEHDRRHDFVPHPNCVFSKPYGRTIVAIFKPYPPEDVPDEPESNINAL